MVIQEATKYVNANAREHAYLVGTELNQDMATCRSVVSAFEGYYNIPPHQREELYNEVLKNVLIDNPHFISFWTSWELTAIDPGYNREHGRERYTYYREGDEIIYKKEILETDVDNPSGIYYNIKSAPSEVITEPYWFSYTDNTDDQILEASVCVPLIDNGRFAGLIGADVELERFHAIIDYIQPFEGSYAIMVSSEGNIISHPDRSLTNTSIKNSELNITELDIINKINRGSEFSFRLKLEDQKTYYLSFAPFTIGDYEQKWYIGIVTPMEVILSDANKNLVISGLAGLAGCFLIALITWLVARRITTPLVKTTSILKDLSIGKIDESSNIEVKTHDEIGEMGKALNTMTNSLKTNAEFAIEIGKGNLEKEFHPLSDQDVLGNSLLQMRSNLQELREINNSNNWLKESVMKIGELLHGEKTATELANQLLSSISGILDVKVGALYLEEDGVYNLIGSYAFNIRKGNANRIHPGSGLVGQAALEKKRIIFTDIPEDYISIKSGLGEKAPSVIIIIPLIYQETVVGVMELAATSYFDNLQLDFLYQINENIAIAFNSIRIRTEMRVLLQKTQEQAEELRVQQEELREANEELEQQTRALKASEEELQQQQEELKVTNEELEEKTKYLEKQKTEISEKNLKLENAGKDLERKAEELAIASKYKSEFLANMSHELRTPLNSLLILSQDLADNNGKNLTGDQVESAEIIYKSGTDLLTMINDILDLSKIESGKMILNIEPVSIAGIGSNIHQYFKHVTDQKNIGFEIETGDGIPSTINTDQQKIEQIIKNFVSNAIKFTNEGEVRIVFHHVPSGTNLSRSGLKPENSLAISVVDTGIGIPKEKQLEIFEAFQQADGSTSRKFGGTGLGLSISRELAKLLGGEIQLKSEVKKGSEFTLYIPSEFKEDKGGQGNSFEVQREISVKEEVNDIQPENEPEFSGKENLNTKSELISISEAFISDDRQHIGEGDNIILIIEDDPDFAKILLMQGHEKGFKCITTPTGEEGFELAGRYLPKAIILDIRLPGINGWQVLDMLKDDSKTRHIPVHIMSGEEQTIDAFKKGAIGYLTKPIEKNELDKAFQKLEGFINRKMSKLLLVEDNPELRKSIKMLIGQADVEFMEAGTGNKAFDLIQKNKFDCVVLDLGLPDINGFDLIKKLDKELADKPPIIVYTGKDLSKEEDAELKKYAETIILKGVKSEARLLDETALFLHRVIDKLPEKQQDIIKKLHSEEEIFRDKKILLVDDDMRNVFALTKVLTDKNMKIQRADNGKTAIDLLDSNSNIDLVLMDIMMPVMDGIEAIKNIRRNQKLDNVPIIALTAKAMKDDRKKCIDAGANDYLTKPINIEKLLSLMRVWLYK